LNSGNMHLPLCTPQIWSSTQPNYSPIQHAWCKKTNQTKPQQTRKHWSVTQL